MLRNFGQVIHALDGSPITVSAQDSTPATLARVCTDVLMTAPPGEPNPTGDDKVARYKLASRIHKGGVVEVTAEDVALLKRLIGLAYQPNVVGPAYEALEKDAPATVAEAA